MLRKIIHFTDHMVNAAIALFCILLLLYGGYALWDTAQVNRTADSGLYETYKPESDNSLSLDELRALNPEVFGWLTINDTHIDYPLVQGENNTKYVNTDVEGNFSLSGSIFLDAQNNKNFSDFNNIIYGHHMEKDAMFGELDNFDDEIYFQEHKNGKLYYDDAWHSVEFFAFVHADAYDKTLYNTELQSEGQTDYLSYLRQNATVFDELSFEDTDHYVTLSTCSSSSTNGRYLLIGRIKNAEA